MPDKEPTLSDLFALQLPSTRARWRSPEPSIDAKLVKLATKATGFPTPLGAGTAIFNHLESVLQSTVGTLLTNAWNKRQEILKYADVAKYPPEKPNFVGLAPHDVKWEAVPSVRISVNEGPYKTVEFKFEGKFHIEAGELKIQGGRILSMRTGRSWFEGKLTSGKIELIKRKSREAVLPGEIVFGNGIPIRQVPAKSA
jgi:hypothetical protein